MADQEQKHPAGAPGVWKAPNFLLIVILFGVAILLVLGSTFFFLHKDARTVLPKEHQTVPSQN